MATSSNSIGAAAPETKPLSVALNELRIRNQAIKAVIIYKKISSRAGSSAELERHAKGGVQLRAAAEGRAAGQPSAGDPAPTLSGAAALQGSAPTHSLTPTHTRLVSGECPPLGPVAIVCECVPGRPVSDQPIQTARAPCTCTHAAAPKGAACPTLKCTPACAQIERRTLEASGGTSFYLWAISCGQ